MRGLSSVHHVSHLHGLKQYPHSRGVQRDDDYGPRQKYSQRARTGTDELASDAPSDVKGKQ